MLLSLICPIGSIFDTPVLVRTEVLFSAIFFFSYCDQLKSSESTHVLQPFLPSILDGLIHLATQFSSEVLNLVMETLCIVCTVDPAFTASVENKICPFTIAIFLKYSNGMCLRFVFYNIAIFCI